MDHSCKELLECKRAMTSSIDEYEDCLDRKAAVLVDSAAGTNITLGDFFAAMDELSEVAHKAKNLAASRTVL